MEQGQKKAELGQAWWAVLGDTVDSNQCQLKFQIFLGSSESYTLNREGFKVEALGFRV